jgi:predicted RNase H-like nuclease (RuvC/YqgF family)
MRESCNLFTKLCNTFHFKTMQFCCVKISSPLNINKMKKTILSLAVITFFAGSISTVFAQTPDKASEKARKDLVEAQKDVTESKQDLKQAQKDSVAEFQQYKKESEEKIKSNEKSIAKLKVNLAQVNETNKAAYQKSVGELEQKNTELKKQLVDYKYDNQSNWDIFKLKFNNELDSLIKSIKDFTSKNS